MAADVRARGEERPLTIFALSSGAPPAAIAVVRISGARASDAIKALAGALPEPRVASLRALRAPGDGRLLDRALLLWFPGPASATGEDLAELHLHGGRAVVAAVEAALLGVGLRRAEPGEFTRRALNNGRIDLAEAEGLGDLLLAQTESQRRAALASAEGVVSRAISGWAAAILNLAAHAEAAIDFSDEGDVIDTVISHTELAAGIGALSIALTAAIDHPPIERLRDGISVVIAGPPNAGKSTLLNALVEREAAIVSPIAGTTRDRVEAQVVMDGHAYRFSDTAGLVDGTGDPIERIGVARSHAALAESDIILWLADTPYPKADDRVIEVHGRADIPERERPRLAADVSISAANGSGMTELRALLSARASALEPRLDRLALNRRQRELVIEARDLLVTCAVEPDAIVAAEQLRQARLALDRITGAVGTEAMLDALFARFCVGK